MSPPRPARALLAFLPLVALLLGLVAGAHPAAADIPPNITVTTTADTNGISCDVPNVCSLRDAVRSANAATAFWGSPIPLTITLPPGTYSLTQVGRGEDNAASGDLDIKANLTINGGGAGQTIINATGTDRIFDIFGGYNLTLNNLTVTNGDPGRNGDGGAIRSAGSLTVDRCVVNGNTTTGAGRGGAISAGGPLTIQHSTIYNNFTDQQGGGIYATGTLLLENSTLSANNTNALAGGLAFGGGSGTLRHVTVAYSVGTGIERSAGTLTLQNTIVTNNTGAGCVGTIADGGNNLDSGATCGFGSGSLSNANAHLHDLASSFTRGATIPYHGLHYDSAARDRVPTSGANCPTNDQTDTPRPLGDRCDSGAVEERWSSRLAISPASGPAGGTTSLTATLTDYIDLLPIAGRIVAFAIDGTAVGSATTDGAGLARLDGVSLAGLAPGAHTIGAAYTMPSPADNVSGSSGSATLTVTGPGGGGGATATLTLGTTGSAGSITRSPAGTGSGPFTYPVGSVVAVSGVPVGGGIFTGWILDGAPAGWADPLTLTLNADHTLVATFAPPQVFGDVPVAGQLAEPVGQLAARGVINGCGTAASPPLFCPAEPTLRAQMAALIVRAIPGWSGETWPNTFSDPLPDAELWSRVATLQHYNAAQGYQPEVCAAQGKAAPCFGPLDNVTYGQTILFITRAMINRGYWTLQPDDRSIFPDQNGASGADPNTDRQTLDHRALVTYVHYTGAPPDMNASAGNPFGRSGVTNGGWADPSSRAWFARALWKALDGYFGNDTPGSGGYVP